MKNKINISIIQKIKQNPINISIAVIVFIFLVLLVVTKLFKITDLPLQTIGVLFGAVITALITYFLLLGQSQAEEIKERNVRVFEEKSKRYNIFIDKLWEIWKDRKVTLEELNELIELISKHIILYTKQESVEKILDCLNNIAILTNNENNNAKDKEETKTIQNNIFEIINVLAKEINLGGEIKPEIKNKLNELEEKVLPFLIKKDFIKKYLEDVTNTLHQSEEVEFTKVEFKNNQIWCQVKDSNVFFVVGRLERLKDQKPWIGIYVEFFNNRIYQKYRDAARGWRKNYLKKSRYDFNPNDIINFNDFETIEKLYYQSSQTNAEDKNENELAKKIIHHYQNWDFGGKKIEEIIEECTIKN